MTIIRFRINGIKQDIKNPFTSTKSNCNRDTGLFDVINFKIKRKELDNKEKKDYHFHQQQYIAIVFVYKNIFCKLEEYIKNAHDMVLNV